MNIYESAEDYLERILILQERNENVRSIDLAHDMGFSKPSVSVAVHKLADNGYIDIADDGVITLTEKGNEIATKVYDRHVTISKALMSLGVSEEQALEDACKIEHDLSEESFESIKKAVNKYEQTN